MTTRPRIHRRSLAWIVAAALTCIGCVGPFGKKPLQLRVVGDARQNATNGRGNAVVLRVYQLADKGRFDRATLRTLWGDDAAALGEDLVAKRELTLLPDRQERIELEVAKRTRYVGIVADFIAPDADAWRHLYPVAALKKGALIRVGERQLVVGGVRR